MERFGSERNVEQEQKYSSLWYSVEEIIILRDGFVNF